MKKTVTHNGISCTFDPQWHTYKTSNGIKLTSGTTFLKTFFNVFDTQEISRKYAKKNGLSQQEVLDTWAAKGKISQEVGTAVHLYAEKYFENQHELVKDGLKYSPYFERLSKLFPHVEEFIDKLLETKQLVECEKIIFSEKNSVAGTIDLLMRDQNTLYLYDWKTNEKIEKTNSFKNCLGKLWAYPDCNFMHYTAQLNLYREILIAENYFPDVYDIKMALFHITPIGVVEIPVDPFPAMINFLEKR